MKEARDYEDIGNPSRSSGKGKNKDNFNTRFKARNGLENMPLPPRFQEPAATGYADMRGSLGAAAQTADLNNWRLEARVYMGEVVS